MILDTSQRYDKPTLAIGFHVWVDIHAPMDVVFQHLTDERELAKWWCSKATSEPRVGGRLHFVWHGDPEITGDALFRRFEYPAHVAMEWTHHNGELIVCDGEGHRGMKWPPLNIYELAMINGTTTRVHLHDLGISGDKRYQELVGATAEGWKECLSRLKKVVENRQRAEVTSKVRKASRQAPKPED